MSDVVILSVHLIVSVVRLALPGGLRPVVAESRPNYHPSTDNDPLYRFPQWQANLRVLEVTEIKTVPYVPLSRPFV